MAYICSKKLIKFMGMLWLVIIFIHVINFHHLYVNLNKPDNILQSFFKYL
jgi:hypothetical protein